MEEVIPTPHPCGDDDQHQSNGKQGSGHRFRRQKIEKEGNAQKYERRGEHCPSSIALSAKLFDDNCLHS